MANDDLGPARSRRDAQLTAVDRAMLDQVEALYGPIRRTPEGTDAIARGPEPRRRAGLAGSVVRTLLFLATAFLVWYALAGGEASVQRVIALLVSGTGDETPDLTTEPTPEYVLAARTMHVDRLAPDDQLIRQFKVLLDALAPKCKEDRVQLAMAVIDAHATKLSRGVEVPMLTILAQTDASLTEQTRSTWPVSCASLIARL